MNLAHLVLGSLSVYHRYVGEVPAKRSSDTPCVQMKNGPQDIFSHESGVSERILV